MSYKLFIHLFNKYFQRDSRESEHIFWYQMDPVFNCMTSGKLFNLGVSDSWTVQQLIIVPTPQREHRRQCSTEKVLSKDWEANYKALFLVALGYLPVESSGINSIVLAFKDVKIDHDSLICQISTYEEHLNPWMHREMASFTIKINNLK